MGLDSIEILMKVEETFEINIPDNEAEKIITVGDFHNLVWQYLDGRYSSRCKSQALFYKLRQSIFDTLQIPKNEFQLNSSLNNIFPKEKRREVYFNFSANTSLELPKLRLPKSWGLFLNIFGWTMIAGGLGISLYAIKFLNYGLFILIIPLTSIFLTTYLSTILNTKRIIIKPDLVKEFTQEVLTINYKKLIKENGANRKDVESVINHIIAEKAGLELQEVTPEKKIHNDLGVD